MNSKQAKEIDLYSFLKNIGIEPTHSSGTNIFYKSPFRPENEPSFKINSQKNVWFDFGEGIGGNIIDFVIKLNHCSVSDALQFIGQDKTFIQPQENHFLFSTAKTVNIENFQLKPIQNQNLLDYINKRGLNLSITKQHCQECSYNIEKRFYYAIAFKNDVGGYEIRNKYAKLNLFGKGITKIINNNKSSTISVFEGFIDFLSYLTINNNVQDNYLVLNSTAMTEKAIEELKGFKNVCLFLDNDNTGKQTTQRIMQAVEHCQDKSSLYSQVKDYNELLLLKKEK